MLRRPWFLLTTLALGAWLISSVAQAENRIALVIGNSDYRSVSALPNPANDAKAMEKLLAEASFEVISTANLTQTEMRRAISDFAQKAALKGPDTVSLVFYAGHGLQVDGENYLVPVDAKIEREADVAINGVRLADVVNALASVPSRTRIVILDACRNNPFGQISRSTAVGLSVVEAPIGSMVAFSTAPGATAADGAGSNSPFTAALLEIAKEPGLPVEQAFKRVRLAVHQATEGQQTPWETSSLTADFTFFGGGPGLESTPVAKRQGGIQLASIDNQVRAKAIAWRKEVRGRSAQEAYEFVLGEDEVEGYQEFIAAYPSFPLGERVRSLLERRKQMNAWYATVTRNTPAAYKAYLQSYPQSDTTATAQRLLERAQMRTLAALPDNTCVAPTTPAPTRVIKEKGRKVEKEKKTKEKPKTRRAGRTPPPDDDEPPPSRASAPPISIGIGIGLGGFGRRGGGGGHHPRGGGSSMPSHSRGGFFR